MDNSPQIPDSYIQPSIEISTLVVSYIYSFSFLTFKI